MSISTVGWSPPSNPCETPCDAEAGGRRLALLYSVDRRAGDAISACAEARRQLWRARSVWRHAGDRTRARGHVLRGYALPCAPRADSGRGAPATALLDGDRG